MGKVFLAASILEQKRLKWPLEFPILLRRYQISIRHENWVICFLLAGAIVGLTCTSLSNDPA